VEQRRNGDQRLGSTRQSARILEIFWCIVVKIRVQHVGAKLEERPAKLERGDKVFVVAVEGEEYHRQSKVLMHATSQFGQ